MSAVEPTAMDAAEARERVERVKAAVTQARGDLVSLWRERAWLSLGYESWDALCDAEFGVRMALGPQGEHVAALIERARALTSREVIAARDAAWAAAWDAARDAARDAAWALVVRDLISTEHYDALSLPWRAAVGRIHPDDPEVSA